MPVPLPYAGQHPLSGSSAGQGSSAPPGLHRLWIMHRSCVPPSLRMKGLHLIPSDNRNRSHQCLPQPVDNEKLRLVSGPWEDPTSGRYDAVVLFGPFFHSHKMSHIQPVLLHKRPQSLTWQGSPKTFFPNASRQNLRFSLPYLKKMVPFRFRHPNTALHLQISDTAFFSQTVFSIPFGSLQECSHRCNQP